MPSNEAATVAPSLAAAGASRPGVPASLRADLRLDVVIPVLNEAHVLEKSVATLRQFLEEQLNVQWRVVIVDNGSTDGTDGVATLLSQKFDDVQCVRLPQRGRGRALRHAWTQSDADVMCYMDVDLSTELNALAKVVGAIENDGCGVATGSRLQRTSRTTRSFKREFISRCYNLFVKIVLRTSFSDAQCGFKAISREAVAKLVPEVADQAWFFDTELLVLAERRGFRVADIAVEWIEDQDSRVKIIKTAWDDIKGVMRLRWKFWREAIPFSAAPQRAVD